MQLFKLAVLAIAFFYTTEACKCVLNGPEDVAGTQACCAQSGGTFSGDDCVAHSIKNKLSNFRNCCKGRAAGETSDCDCPKGCGVVERHDILDMREITTAGAVMTII